MFRTDFMLGYGLNAGAFRITETEGNHSHRFLLTVDEQGRRITAYRPNTAARRMYISGDSGMFGWGLDDEQTIPWLMQTRFPEVEVVNLSLTSYSTIQALRQLKLVTPNPGPDDIVIMSYHPITNEFNVASTEMLNFLEAGFERQLGDQELAENMMIPYGSINRQGELMIGHFQLACRKPHAPQPQCAHPDPGIAAAMQVTEKAFDAIMTSHPAHYVVAFISGVDSDPVIAHLKSMGALIADLRTTADEPDAKDEVALDKHAGPFWHHMIFERLTQAMLADHLIE